MFEYFPGHYSWNLGLLMAAQLGGEMTEIDQACRPLLELAQRPNAKDDPEAQAAWIERWSTLAGKVEELARRDEQRATHSRPGRNTCAQASIGSRPSVWRAMRRSKSSPCIARCWTASAAACACVMSRSSSSIFLTRAQVCPRCFTAHRAKGESPQ